MERRNILDQNKNVANLQTLITYLSKAIRDERKLFFKRYPVTPTQYDVLMCLRKKNMTISALSDEVLLDSSTLVGIVDRLERKGWILKKVSPKDRRKNIITITPKGKNVVDVIPPFVSVTLTKLLTSLNLEEQKQLQKILDKIKRSLNEPNLTKEEHSQEYTGVL